MKNPILLVIIIVQLISYSCDKNESLSCEKVIQIENIEKNVSFQLSDVMDSITYLVLETNDDCLIGNSTKIVHKNDQFFIGDYDVANSIFIFSDSGKYKCKIHAIGQGPGEFLKITDFCVNQRGFIYILDASQEKIITFDNKGKFVRELKLHDCDGDYIGYIEVVNSFAIYSSFRTYQGCSNLMIVNEKGKIEKKYLKISKKVNPDLTIPALDLNSYVPNSIQFCQMYDSNVYRLVDDRLTIAYKFDFGMYSLPDDYIERETVSHNDNYCRVVYTRETENCLYYCVGKKDRIGIGFYLKDQNLNYFGASTLKDDVLPLINDIDHMDFYNFYGSDTTCFFSLYEVSAVINNPEASQRLKNSIKDVDIENNPIIVSYYVK